MIPDHARPETGDPSASIGTDEYVKPEAIFLDIETLKDLTAVEFRYVLGNVLRSSRYGAISSRIGKVKNILAGVVFSDCEIFSNLELTQTVYDQLKGTNPDLDFPLSSETVVGAVRAATNKLSQRLAGQIIVLPPDEVNTLVGEISAFYRDEDAVRRMLEEATAMYGPKR
jgi:CRISPR-associated protein Csc2